MIVTYLGHSGFLVETQSAYYLFDYIRGALPDFSSAKPLYILASHSHEDHFSPLIFQNRLAEKTTKYLLSSDILKTWKHRNPSWLSANSEKLQWLKRNQEVTLDSIIIHALASTDIGIAFVIQEASGISLYHAGDLNWWHWEGEEKAWNRNMEVNYKREIDRISSIPFDAAFVPLDPRLESAYCYGLNYFLQKVSARHIFPMHFWEDYEVIPRYLRQFPLPETSETTIHIINKEGENYEI